MSCIENEIRKADAKKRIRNFFENSGYTEIDAPLLAKYVIPESSIELFRLKRVEDFKEDEDLFLLPSPEIYLKKALCKFKKNIFSISKAFRNNEIDSPLHKNEFTMIEFYTLGKDYKHSIQMTKKMLCSVFKDSPNYRLFRKSTTISVDELLKKYTSYSLSQIHDRNVLSKIENKFSLSLPENEGFDDTFNRIFLHIIEPELRCGKQSIYITDYPVEIACLAKEKNSLTRERFELYIGGIEIANGYSEMTDKGDIEKLFTAELEKIRQNGYFAKADDEFKNLKQAKSSGTAIGFERAMMIAYGIKDINDLCFI